MIHGGQFKVHCALPGKSALILMRKWSHQAMHLSTLTLMFMPSTTEVLSFQRHRGRTPPMGFRGFGQRP